VYKGLEIIPFSGWVTYEDANFSEIIRFSKKHQLEDQDWYFALSYAKDACNLSLTDEDAFVKKYILDECERMVNGLEEILSKTEFTYHLEHIKSDKSGFRIEPTTKKITKTGHELIEFRGEKISGALNFIERILTFEKIRSMHHFVEKIKKLNQRMLPMLVNEVPLITKELTDFQHSLFEIMQEIKPLEVQNAQWEQLVAEFIFKNKLKGTKEERDTLRTEYTSSNKEYQQFLVKLNTLQKKRDNLQRKIFALEATNRNINSYITCIQDYFRSNK
jgi:uncharacterized coiled-coil DUF342 family protein